MITAIDKNTALVLIDFQNAVVAAPVVHSMDKVLNNTNKLIDAFKEKKLPVIFVNVNPGNAAWVQSRKEAAMNAFPTDESLFKITDKLHAASSDIFITKHTWNAFFETTLNEELRKRNVTGIVLAGVSTSIGVEGTARAASELGYNISFALDAMSDRVEEAHERSIQYIFPRIGELGNADDIIAALSR
ncbi:isochorismatase family protein [Parafilimonas sp.]|uniref:isochorismatase family protein n=1 Tax=Parafilimonas sp. TaxID=1969739 RepID=UPI0039E50E74